MKLHKIYAEMAESISSRHFYLGGLVAGATSFLVSIIIFIFFERSFTHIVSSLILSILTALQIIIIVWAHEKIKLFRGILLDIVELPEGEVIRWYQDLKAKIFNYKGMIAVGIIINILAHIVGFDYLGFSFQSEYSQLFIEINYYIAHFITGAALYSLFATALIVHRISKLPLNLNILLSKNIRIKGVLYSEFTICAASVYIMWGFFYMSTPIRLSSMYKIIWFSSFAVLLIAYFILPQYSIHKIMAKAKKEKINTFSVKLSAKANETFLNPTRENASCLKNMLGVQRQIDEMCEWPSDSYEIVHITLIIIIPLIVLMIELIFNILEKS